MEPEHIIIVTFRGAEMFICLDRAKSKFDVTEDMSKAHRFSWKNVITACEVIRLRYNYDTVRAESV